MLMKSSLLPKKTVNAESEMNDFVLRYNLFKDLKEKNAAALRLINDIENMILKPVTFDYDEVVDQCERLVAIVRALALRLEALSRDRYVNLAAAAKRIGRSGPVRINPKALNS